MQSIEMAMLAQDFDPATAVYPLLASHKVDGIRFYVHAGHCWSRSNKPIPNDPIQLALRDILPEGADGELFVTDFSSSTSLVMSYGRVLEGAGLVVCLFDLYLPYTPYVERIKALHTWSKTLSASRWKQTKKGFTHPKQPFTIRLLLPVWISNGEALQRFFDRSVEDGYEGICLREPLAPYIFGPKRTTALTRYKPFVEREAFIISCEEMQRNENEPFTDELGRQRRSKTASGLVPSGILGSFQVRDCETEIAFNVGGGPGLTQLLRSQLWAERLTLGGKIIKYRCLDYGAKDKPRQPQFLGFRDERDML